MRTKTKSLLLFVLAAVMAVCTALALAGRQHAVEVILEDGILEPLIVAARDFAHLLGLVIAALFGALACLVVLVDAVLLPLGGDFAERVFADVRSGEIGRSLSESRDAEC